VKIRIRVDEKMIEAIKKTKEIMVENVQAILNTRLIVVVSFFPQYWAVRMPAPVDSPK
jgi:hypothetical protein